MSRYINSVPQILDGNGDPIAGAKKAMYTPGTTNFKTIYSDSTLATPRTNPVTADADGRFPEFFLDGLYDEVQQDASGTVDTDDGVTIWTRDNVGDVSTGPFELWDSGTVYSIPQIVLGSDDEYYRSLIDSNQGNDPTSSAVQWEQLEFGRIWNTNITYAIGDSVYGSDGQLYICLVSQSGNDPTGDIVNWDESVTASSASILVNKELTSPTITSPKIDEIHDTNGNASIIIEATPDAVNEMTVTNAKAVAVFTDTTTLAFVAPDQITDSGSGFGIFTAGDIVAITGATAANNSGTFVVATAVAGQLDFVEQTITSETPSASSVVVTSQVASKIDATGDDTNIGLNLAGKGSGVIKLGGTAITDDSGGTGGGGYGGRVLIEAVTVSVTSTTVDFETGIDSTYKAYVVELINVIPATDIVSLETSIQIGGSTWVAGTNYTDSSASGQSSIALTAAAVSNTAANSGINGHVHLFGPSDTTVQTNIHGYLGHISTGSGLYITSTKGGQYDALTAVTGIRFAMNSGNITSGKFRLYGVIV